MHTHTPAKKLSPYWETLSASRCLCELHYPVLLCSQVAERETAGHQQVLWQHLLWTSNFNTHCHSLVFLAFGSTSFACCRCSGHCNHPHTLFDFSNVRYIVKCHVLFKLVKGEPGSEEALLLSLRKPCHGAGWSPNSVTRKKNS